MIIKASDIRSIAFVKCETTMFLSHTAFFGGL